MYVLVGEQRRKSSRCWCQWSWWWWWWWCGHLVLLRRCKFRSILFHFISIMVPFKSNVEASCVRDIIMQWTPHKEQNKKNYVRLASSLVWTTLMYVLICVHKKNRTVKKSSFKIINSSVHNFYMNGVLRFFSVSCGLRASEWEGKKKNLNKKNSIDTNITRTLHAFTTVA